MLHQINKQLFADIAAIDIRAAAWIANTDLERFRLRNYGEFNSNTTDLIHTFAWEKSPQGSNYWRILRNKITMRNKRDAQPNK